MRHTFGRGIFILRARNVTLLISNLYYTLKCAHLVLSKCASIFFAQQKKTSLCYGCVRVFHYWNNPNCHVPWWTFDIYLTLTFVISFSTGAADAAAPPTYIKRNMLERKSILESTKGIIIYAIYAALEIL